MSETYAAWWPIHDDERTRTELVEEATDDLADMVAAQGRIITGWVKWDVHEVDTGPVLMALAPVKPVEHQLPRSATNRRGMPSEHLVENVEFLLEHDPAITTRAVAARLGLNKGSVQDALRRAGRQDLTRRLSRNTPGGTT
jgi:hypothetical protein